MDGLTSPETDLLWLELRFLIGKISSVIGRLRLRLDEGTGAEPNKFPEDFSRVRDLVRGGNDGSLDKSRVVGIEGARDNARGGALFIGRGSSGSGESSMLA